MSKCIASFRGGGTSTLLCLTFVTVVKECIPQFSFEHPHIEKIPL